MSEPSRMTAAGVAPGPPRFTLFDTALGVCGLAWTEAGISRVALPEDEPERTRARFTGAEGQPPAEVRLVLDGVIRLLAGEPVEFAGARLDRTGVPEFNWRVYELTRGIPPGATLSYGDIAARLGQPGAARAVGRALGDNPYPIVVPCHRVVAANGSMHGFSGPGGISTKRRMLQIEGALAPDAPTLF